MAGPQKVILAWSGGKDCALALDEVRRAARLEVTGLLTTVTDDFDRISLHGVRRDLLRRQVDAIGLALHEVGLPADSGEELYEQQMRAALEQLRGQGVRGVVFGDVFLHDVRQHRQDKLAQVGMSAHFPLWGRDTADLARQFLARGFRAVLTCVDTQALDGRFAGADYDHKLLEQLPPSVDACGENGEFHTFVYDGPLFSHAICFTRGQVVLRKHRFAYCDLLPAEG